VVERVFRLAELAREVGGSVAGNPERVLRGVATLDAAGPDELTFLTNPRYRKAAEATRAGAVLVPQGADLPGRDLLVAPEPYVALARILELFHPRPPRRPGVSPDARLGQGVEVGEDVEIAAFAVIGDGVVLGDRATVGAGAVIGDGCRIGPDTVLMPRSVLYPGTWVGASCLIHAGVVLGSDGFGFATSKGVHHKVPQVGRVVVEDDVEIGANTTVDRATLGETTIGQGTKIDNLVMVAHGVRIGPGGLLAGQAGIAGSTRIGSHVTFAGQAGAGGHLEIGDGSVVAAKTAVFQDLPPRSFVAGIPAVDHRDWKRTQAALKRLASLLAELRDLRARIERLEAGGSGPE
jgi:UDP-3-O-[3-hydroxymyristoyl] glucosamine N-acyltransferase